MRRITLLTLLFVTLLCGCGHKVEQGVVTGKKHCPMHVTQTTVLCGKSVIVIPVVEPETWSVVVKDGDKEETFHISSELYENLSIGDSIDFNETK